MIVIGLSCMFYFGDVLWCPPCCASVWDYLCWVLQCVHDSLIVGGESDRSLYPSKGVVAYGSREDLILARVSIISAYDPSMERMLAHASPSYKIAIMITGLVIDCLWTNLPLCVTKSFLLNN